MKSLEIESMINSRLYNFEDHGDNKVWVIGDVHGCNEQFDDLLWQIRKEDGDEAVIYQLGDMIDRGPSLLSVYLYARDYNVRLLIGNHEINFLTEHDGNKKCNSGPRVQTHNRFNHLSDEQKELVLSSMRTSKPIAEIMVEGKNFVLSHAPIHELVNRNFVESIDVGNAWNYCTCNIPYPDDMNGNEVYIHGHQHWNYKNIEFQKQRLLNGETCSLNIDSGCVYGKELIAVRLNDFKVLKESNDQDYSK